MLIYLVSQIVKMYSEEPDPEERLLMDGAVMLIIKPVSVDEKKNPISNYFFEWSPGIPRLVSK